MHLKGFGEAMGVFWSVLKRPLFSLDPESVHRFAVSAIRVGIRLGVFRQRPMLARLGQQQDFRLRLSTLRSPVGLAAGFDKDCEILEALPTLGFGFAEIGTVTPKPQPGNERPRLFRDPQAGTLFNRMGFNSAGAEAVSRRLRMIKPSLPEDFLVGVNLGKNKETPLEKSFQDYVEAARFFEGIVDYLVINVSSPNTPDLRSLQTVDGLRPIIEGLRDLLSYWRDQPPLFLKIGPELYGEQLHALMQALDRHVDGWIFTNTLGGFLEYKNQKLQGGWSGKVLAEESRRVLVQARSLTEKIIISVGGIDSEQEAAQRMKLGADLIQIYTGWIYQGPRFPLILAKMFNKMRDGAKKKPQAEA